MEPWWVAVMALVFSGMTGFLAAWLQFLPKAWVRFDQLETKIAELKEEVSNLKEKLGDTQRALSQAIQQLARAGEPIGADLDVEEAEDA